MKPKTKKLVIKPTYQLLLEGQPTLTCRQIANPTLLKVVPNAIPFIVPKLRVKEHDSVKIGTCLFVDKKRSYLRFMSPGAGIIKKIVLGPRRCIEAIYIERHEKEESIVFPTYTEETLQHVSRDQIIEQLITAGLWHMIKALPFRHSADPKKTPPAIIVSLDDSEPFLPQSQHVLRHSDALMRLGFKILETLSSPCHVVVHEKNRVVQHLFPDKITHHVTGDYPATDPGVILHHIKQSPEDNQAWYVHYQDVLRMASLFLNGTYPIGITAVVAGSLLNKPCHVQTREGIMIKHLLQQLPEEARYIAGGVYTGRSIDREGALNYSEYAVHVLPEQRSREWLHFFKPGQDKPSYFRTFLSTILPKQKWSLSTSVNGGLRACISCSACPDICPVGLLPQFIKKAVYAKDTELAINLGLLDCVECGLCSYICPSKIELADDLKTAKHALYKESQHDVRH